MADIWIQQAEDLTYMFRIRNDRARMVFSSQGHKTRKACVDAVAVFKESSLHEENYERHVDQYGQYFTLKAGKFKARSCTYFSEKELEEGIPDVRECLQKGGISYLD